MTVLSAIALVQAVGILVLTAMNGWLKWRVDKLERERDELLEENEMLHEENAVISSIVHENHLLQ